MVDLHLLQQTYKLLPHGPSLQVITQIIQLDKDEMHCVINPAECNPLIDENSTLIASFTCVEYAAQAAAIHAILMGAHYDPNRPAFIGAVKEIQLLRNHYAKSAPVKICARQEFSQNDGAIYSFTGYASDELLINGRLILKNNA